MKNILNIIILTLFSYNVFATVPENGWWWNPQHLGGGYDIKIENNALFITTFIYNQQGQPIWYSGRANNIGSSENTITIDFFESKEGAYSNYTDVTVQSSTHPSMQSTLSFIDENHGTITTQNQLISIERFYFNSSKGIAKMLGAWSVNLPYIKRENGIIGFADIVLFSQIDNHQIVDRDSRTIISQTNIPNVYVSLNKTSDKQYLAIVGILQSLNSFSGIATIVNNTASVDQMNNMLQNNGTLMLGYRSESIRNLDITYPLPPLQDQEISTMSVLLNKLAKSIDSILLNKVTYLNAIQH
ncbi:hypothetical protein [Candidatus Nitrosacidococcus tergens]|uniref:Uncharacterized protein n=1 Tax=Candidatus Nitrosacidococcus tergens TaxID=553981 RepID=A0A7G1QBS3_9GAMM|nr:hypothetical protein [Candidatus Nitrosacidococcus tergens]CAB1277421.1 protein of unknown function [Candidatus Nitrosacidococcus tergens]